MKVKRIKVGFSNLPWLLASQQPCYQLDRIYSPQEACIQCHLHIYQSHSTTA